MDGVGIRSFPFGALKGIFLGAFLLLVFTECIAGCVVSWSSANFEDGQNLVQTPHFLLHPVEKSNHKETRNKKYPTIYIYITCTFHIKFFLKPKRTHLFLLVEEAWTFNFCLIFLKTVEWWDLQMFLEASNIVVSGAILFHMHSAKPITSLHQKLNGTLPTDP